MGKFFILLGLAFVGVGLLILLSSRFSFFRLGRLPGDILIKRGDFSFYFPLTTCILLSLLLTLIFSLLSRK
ncbi:MAG TPA: DUF2905 domain-containing protein [Terriglobia bacterium]|nr:DUF2905 domain-containing protein [Terriglobia bacterium]